MHCFFKLRLETWKGGVYLEVWELVDNVLSVVSPRHNRVVEQRQHSQTLNQKQQLYLVSKKAAERLAIVGSIQNYDKKCTTV